MVTSGPPELPGLAAASNWIRLVISCLPSGERNTRPRPETMPAEAEGPMPKGKPTASTLSPGARSLVERMGLYELLAISETFKDKVNKEPSIQALKKQGIADGMRPLRLAGALRVAEGLTTMEEVLAATPPLD